jgi:leucyl-tRNA synthetase
VDIVQEMIKDDAKLRQGEQNYHDMIFVNEINELINVTQGHYEA